MNKAIVVQLPKSVKGNQMIGPLTKSAAKRLRKKLNKQQKQQQSPKVVNFNVPKQIVPRQQVSLTQGASLPPTSFEVTRGPKPDSMKIKGRDYIGIVKSPSSGVTVGTNLRTDYLSPGGPMFNGTRLAKFATLYEKYVFRRFKVMYIPMRAATDGGSIGMAFDKDYADSTPNPAEDGLRQYLAYQNATTFPQWSYGEIDVKLTDMQDFYYCNDTGYEGRLVYQGQLYTFAVGNLNSDYNYGTLYAEYEIDFFDPQLENPLDYTTLGASAPVVSGASRAGWNNLFSGIQGVGKIVSDENGNQGIELSPGTYILEQAIESASTATKWLDPITQTVSGIGTVVLATLINSSNSASGSYRSTRVTVTGGSIRMFGYLQIGATLANCIIRVIRSQLNAVA